MARILLIAVTLLAAMAFAPAFGDEAAARAALARALDAADRDARGPGRLAFTETVAEKGVRVSARFEPHGQREGKWRPLTPLTKGQERETYRSIVRDTPNESDLFLNRIRASLGDSGRLVSEQNGHATFDFAMDRRARPTHSPLDGALNLAEHIRIELKIDAHAGRLDAMRFYAPAPFSATPLARVERIDMKFTFGPSFPGGPVVVRQIDTDAAYRLAGLANIVRDTVWFSDIEPATPGSANETDGAAAATAVAR